MSLLETILDKAVEQDTLVSLVPTSVTVRVITARNNHVVLYSVWESEASEFWYHWYQ